MKRPKVLAQQRLDHHADTLNKNPGTPGTNLTNAQVHGNRGKQMNPNQQGKAHVIRSPAPSSKPRTK